MCTTFVAKLVLGIINTLVFLAGLAMFIVGLLVYTQPSFSQEALSGLLAKLEDTAETAGVEVDTSDFSVADVAFSFIIAIIVFGIFLAAVSVLGLVGVKYSLKPVLIVYFIITLVLFLAQVALVLVAVIDRDAFNDVVKPRLKDSITSNFEGIESSEPVTMTWNGIMAELECCGVDDYTDFTEASKSGKWTRTIGGTFYTLITPVACCKSPENPYTCAITVTDAVNNWKTGCYTKMWDYLLSNSGIVIGIATGVLLAQLVILILTIIIIKSVGQVAGIV